MELPLPLRRAIEDAAQGYSIAELRQISDLTTAKYRAEKASGERLVTDECQATAYAIARMPATYAAICAAFGSAAQLMPDLKIDSMLDVGAGTGAAAWAAINFFRPVRIDCVEREPAMIDLGKRLMRDFAAADAVTWHAGDALSFPRDRRYDLVIAAYALNEMTPQYRRRLIAELWSAVSKILILVETGTPKAHLLQQDARKQLLDVGAYLVAPCPHAQTCALDANDWCHFTCRVARSRLHRAVKNADAPYEDEKFTYSAFSKTLDFRHCTQRVLRHPIISTKSIGLRLCRADGAIVDTTVKKGDADYKRARKVDCGDAFVIDSR